MRRFRLIVAMIVLSTATVVASAPVAQALESPPSDESMVVAITQCAQAGDSTCVEALVRIVFSENPDWAVRIATRESGLRCRPPNNGTGIGLFQLLGHEKMAADMGIDPTTLGYDCLNNATVAHALFLACGTKPWEAPNFGCSPWKR